SGTSSDAAAMAGAGGNGDAGAPGGSASVGAAQGTAAPATAPDPLETPAGADAGGGNAAAIEPGAGGEAGSVRGGGARKRGAWPARRCNGQAPSRTRASSTPPPIHQPAIPGPAGAPPCSRAWASSACTEASWLSFISISCC